jgi:hypothetical protein
LNLVTALFGEVPLCLREVFLILFFWFDWSSFDPRKCLSSCSTEDALFFSLGRDFEQFTLKKIRKICVQNEKGWGPI